MSRFMWYFFFICTLGRYNHYLINTTSDYKHEPLHLQIINTFFSIFTLLPSVLSSTGVNKLQPSPKVTFVPLKCMAKGLKERDPHMLSFFFPKVSHTVLVARGWDFVCPRFSIFSFIFVCLGGLSGTCDWKIRNWYCNIDLAVLQSICGFVSIARHRNRRFFRCSEIWQHWQLHMALSVANLRAFRVQAVNWMKSRDVTYEFNSEMKINIGILNLISYQRIHKRKYTQFRYTEVSKHGRQVAVWS